MFEIYFFQTNHRTLQERHDSLQAQIQKLEMLLAQAKTTIEDLAAKLKAAEKTVQQLTLDNDHLKKRIGKQFWAFFRFSAPFELHFSEFMIIHKFISTVTYFWN